MIFERAKNPDERAKITDERAKKKTHNSQTFFRALIALFCNSSMLPPHELAEMHLTSSMICPALLGGKMRQHQLHVSKFMAFLLRAEQ